MKKIYIAGKLNDDAVGYNNNKARMFKTALEVKNAGYSIFVPSVLDRLAEIEGNWTYDDYFNNSQPWLMVSDAVFLTPGWEDSSGTKAEMATANDLNIPVFYDLNAMNEHFQMVETLNTFNNGYHTK